MQVVIPNSLWLGNAREARNISGVLAMGVMTVVVVAAEKPPITMPRDLVYCRVPLVDGAGNRPELIRAAVGLIANFIESGSPTLVACGAGMSRSPAITAAALAQAQKKSLHWALDHITSGTTHDISTSLWADIEAIGGR